MPFPFRDCYNKTFLMPHAARLVLLAAALALAFALVMEHGFGLRPCILCLWQRAPLITVIMLAGLACLPPLYRYAPALLGLCGIAFLTGAGIAVFHTGVELHWWLGTSGCSIVPLSGATPQDIRAQLLSTAVARCDEISWSFLGLSMANYNIAFSSILAAFSFLAARRAMR
ncbi:MAG: disulfide bond formation protein B [Bdellovibrionales bacterium]